MEDQDTGLSVGRSRRSTAGNRMRELLEQERERLEAKRANDEDEMFQEEEGDVDFEAKAEEGEDIIDSDFDQSSDDGEAGDDDDELQGERELEEEERAARKASRIKASATSGIRRPPAPSQATQKASQESQIDNLASSPRRIRFDPKARSSDGAATAAAQRSSKRKSTIDATLSVQARLKLEEKRKQEAIEKAVPKRKKVRLSQADRIAEALEMEEQNRESLKKYLELEQERREKDRRRGKKIMQEPYLRCRSFIEDRNAPLQRKFVRPIEEEKSEGPSNKAITVDPAIAAREAARQERERREKVAGHKEDAEKPTSSEVEQIRTSQLPLLTVSDCEETSAQGRGMTTADVDMTERKEEGEAEEGPQNASQIVEKQGEAAVAAQTEIQASSIDECTAHPRHEADIAASSPMETTAESAIVINPGDSEDVSKEGNTQERERKETGREEGENNILEMLVPEPETRNLLSLHQLPPDTPWNVSWSYILGSHVDWSNYPYVPARNRPLRPRQVICPITGLAALYKDPRSGIAYANMEAYQTLTRLMAGQYLWSGRPSSSSSSSQDRRESSSTPTTATVIDKIPTYDPLEMGCWLDNLNEPGACNVLYTAAAAVGSGALPEYRPRGALAPGDETALVAAAKALPAGTTRSGGRRSGHK